MTVSYVWLDWSICLTWLINCEQTCNLIAFSDVLYGFFMCKCDSKALLTLPACTFRASPWGPWPLQCWAACILFNANWWGAKYRVSEQRDEHGRSGDFREWKFIIEHLIYKQFCWARAGFTTLHGLVPISTLVPQIYIAFAPRTKGRLYSLPCGRWLVKMVSSDFRPWAGTLKKPQLRDTMTWPRACLE